MNLTNVPDDPTICIMCKHYYCTYSITKEDFRPASKSLEEHNQKIKEALENADWSYHRCKGSQITDFNCITGKITRKDEYCTNININGRCKLYNEKGQ